MSECEWFVYVHRITDGQPLETYGTLRYPTYATAKTDYNTIIKAIARWNNKEDREDREFIYFVSAIIHIRYIYTHSNRDK